MKPATIAVSSLAAFAMTLLSSAVAVAAVEPATDERVWLFGPYGFWWLVGIAGASLALYQAWQFFKWMEVQPAGTPRMIEIAGYVRTGADAYLRQQYKVVAMFFGGIFLLLALMAFVLKVQSAWVPFAFISGGLFSGLAGWFGMKTATLASNRTAAGAERSLNEGLQIAFRSGAVMGLTVVGLGLIDIMLWFFILYWLVPGLGFAPLPLEEITVTMLCFGMGASSQALFARVGGGIFTKAADVGADLVGKVEHGIPEDDARNPATIADNVGDNVGDCTGMAADLFETYVVTAVATMVLAAIILPDAFKLAGMVLPLAIGGACVITSIAGTYFVKLGADNNIMNALYKGLIATGVLSLIVLVPTLWLTFGSMDVQLGIEGGKAFGPWNLFWCGVAGLIITALIVVITEYYTGTGKRPVNSIAEASVTGHGTNVIQGLAVSLEATALPALVIIVGIIVTYNLAGLFGIAFAVTTMLALAGMIVALDAFGPVTDNAGGIAEMAGLPKEVRHNTDALDAVGNTTKAVTKGYAIGSAGLGALVLFAAYTQDLQFFSANAAEGSFFYGLGPLTFSLADPYVVVGLLFGGLLPFLFGGMSMTAVGRAAQAVVVEVRRQFKADPGIMAGTSKPDYARAVDMLTKAAIKEMIIPSLLPVLSPIVVFVAIYWIAGAAAGFSALGAMLMGVIVTGLFVAISMTAGGGAWDNAKKSFEDGFVDSHGVKHLKGSDAHKASVTGDTVGDPYKDTAGPAVNPMIKITNIVALLLLAVLAHMTGAA